MLAALRARLKRFVRKRIRWGFDRIDRFRSRPPPFDGRVPPPDRVTIETTRYCNLTCRMCLPFLQGITVTGPHIELERFKRYATQIFPFVSRFSPSVSGEPLMSKGFPEMIALARHFGVELEITTNATLLNERLASMLVGATSGIVFSIDGATKEVFEHIRRDSDFDQVMENVRRFVQKARQLPPAEQPRLGFNTTLMRRNIEELPAIVAMAHEMGVDYVTATHVFPATDEIRAESLIHFKDLARKCIDAAVARANETGIYLKVAPLDHYVEANALATGKGWQHANEDGVVSGLERREGGSLSSDTRRPTSKDPAARARREEARTQSHLPRPVVSRWHFPVRHRQPIWVCEFLWSSIYVQLEGGVRPCCMPGPQEIGNLEKESFEDIWNGAAYREMRQRLVVRDPIGVCKGCQYIREITDDDEIARWLQRKSIPSSDQVVVSPYSSLPANGEEHPEPSLEPATVYPG